MNAKENAASLCEKIGIPKHTVERNLKSLQEKVYIIRLGSKHDGIWIVKK